MIEPLQIPFIVLCGYFVFKLFNPKPDDPMFNFLKFLIFFGSGVIAYLLIGSENLDLTMMAIYFSISITLMKAIDSFFDFINGLSNDPDPGTILLFFTLFPVLAIVNPILLIYILFSLPCKV